MCQCLTLADQRYICKKTREIDSSGAARKRCEAQAAFNENAVDKKRKADTKRRTKAAAKQARIDAVNPVEFTSTASEVRYLFIFRSALFQGSMHPSFVYSVRFRLAHLIFLHEAEM